MKQVLQVLEVRTPRPPGHLEPRILRSLVCEPKVHAVNGLYLTLLH